MKASKDHFLHLTDKEGLKSTCVRRYRARKNPGGVGTQMPAKFKNSQGCMMLHSGMHDCDHPQRSLPWMEEDPNKTMSLVLAVHVHSHMTETGCVQPRSCECLGPNPVQACALHALIQRSLLSTCSPSNVFPANIGREARHTIYYVSA